MMYLPCQEDNLVPETHGLLHSKHFRSSVNIGFKGTAQARCITLPMCCRARDVGLGFWGLRVYSIYIYIHIYIESIWEFPKIGDPNIVPEKVGSLL